MSMWRFKVSSQLMKRIIELIFVGVVFAPLQSFAALPCVFIFYDQGDGSPGAKFGEVYSIQLRNVLGHFPEYSQLIMPIESYQSGLIDACDATIYLGSNYYSSIPDSFYADVAVTDRPVMWMGYSFWNLPEEVQKEKFGVQYSHLTTLNEEVRDKNQDVGFFRYFHYLGETFRKSLNYGDKENKKDPQAAFELLATNPVNDVKVLSWAEHSATGEKLPYITRKENFFFVADIPFSYIHEADRYFIFCDILFDFFNLEPKHKTKLAFLRIEDVHPLIPVESLSTIQETLKEESIPFNISFVPVYAKYEEANEQRKESREIRVPFVEQRDFLTWLRDVRDEGAHIILHGVTHHLDGVTNPLGYSGIDYEFWNVNTDSAPSDGTAGFVLDRLEYAYDLLETEDIYPMIWLTPHYLASPTEYRVFAKAFPWNLGRITYFIDNPQGEPSYWSEEMLKQLQARQGNPLVSDAQRHYFQNYTNEYDSYKLGQLFPYEIYGDYYGQRVIPESLGNVTPKHLGGGVERTVDDILADAKRNRVLRDTWASVFFHPFLLNSVENGGMGEYDNDERELRRLVKGIKDLGYKFMPVEEFMENQDWIRNVEAVELE